MPTGENQAGLLRERRLARDRALGHLARARAIGDDALVANAAVLVQMTDMLLTSCEALLGIKEFHWYGGSRGPGGWSEAWLGRL